jgi:hypothetical protein
MRKMTCSLLLVLVACGSDSDPPPGSPWGVPISGGTMLITRDGAHAVIADPDRDRVVTVDLATQAVVGVIALTAGDEPGRLVEDGAGRIHVALRRGGAIATVDVATSAITARRAVCAEPRGLAWSTTGDALHVACTDGQLVTFPAAGGDATRRLQLDRDLRDVVVTGDQLIVTRFRTAELLTLDAAGTIVSRTSPPTVQRNDFGREPTSPSDFGLVDAIPSVAWRAIGMPDGRVLMAHQRKLNTSLGTRETGGYEGGCGGGPVEDAITVMRPGEAPFAVAPPLLGALPVDIAMSPSGDAIAFANAGTQMVSIVFAEALTTGDTEPCPFQNAGRVSFLDGLGAPTSVAYAPGGKLYVFYPEAPALVAHTTTAADGEVITLPGGAGYDAGRELFHGPASVGLACASCHPEGRDDGQVWDFDEFGARRTQSVAGNVLARAPYHWTGDQVDLHALVVEVFESRMAGGPTSESQRISLGLWLDRIPAPAPITGDPTAIARGKTLFESSEVGCISCHNGPLYTNNVRVDVGTGGLFKVPSLRGVAARAPYLHDGCAPTLLDRLTGACGGGDQHGHTSQLAPDQLADLVVYLESL